MNLDLKELKEITLLYVEDEDMIREQTVSMFNNLFNKTLVAQNGAIGLDLFKHYQNDIDIIVSDINMPELSGLAMAEEIFKINDKIPIILTTAYTDEEYLLKSLDLNINKYITKPLKIKELAICISNEVKKYKKVEALKKTAKTLMTKHLNSEKEVNNLKDDILHCERTANMQDTIINNFISFLKLDNQGEILDVSDKFCILYGYTKEEIINKNISLICENLPLIHKKILESIREKKVQNFTDTFTTKSKEKLKQNCSLYPLYENEDGLVSGYNLFQDEVRF